MEKTYNPNDIETTWYQIWEKSEFFKPQNNGKPYSILLPPPNVTGSLHMGHGFQVTLMDALIRYHRMLGENVLWQMGTDHAGIATQLVVERQLQTQNQTRHDLGREAFVKKVWEWKNESGGNIARQLRRMGASGDWSRECFTMDPPISNAVQEVFIQLYEEGLIYRGKKLVNWDPQLLTAISDLEVISEETQGELWYIRYPLANGTENIIVATTRPETLLGDVAVAVHPDDTRYQHLIGQYLKLPLTSRTIPVIADAEVDPAFGTGCVKITPAHDFNDNAMGQRHQLPLINIFTPDARINENAPEKYQGLDRFAARKKILEDLTAENLLEKTEAHMLKIPRGDRTNAVIEPYLTDQWYMKMSPLAEPAISAVENGAVKFVPENWSKTYFQWLNNIQDWCVSRQLWWGHRIPAWYDETGKAYVGRDEKSVREKHHLNESIVLTQDSDVLDTWFSASLWPFATLGWPEQTQEISSYYPTSVLVTGFDIIFFWVARMIMMGLKFTQQIPFHEVYVTGLIRDHDGQKMSKSKGNVLDPIDLIDGIDLENLVIKRTSGLIQPAMAKKIETATRKQFPNGIPAFGTDALRFTYCALASTGRDIRFDLGRVEGYRNFCNKIWNAARYVLMNTESFDFNSPAEFTIADRWIKSRLQRTIQQAHEHFKNYRFDLLAQSLYEFTWNEFCDWYVELSKPILTTQNSTELLKNGTRKTLIDVLENILRLLHPLMPFITEEIWQQIKILADKKGKSIMLEPYPELMPAQVDEKADAEIEWLKTIILSLRKVRSEMNISPAKLAALLCHKGNPNDRIYFEKHENLIKTLAKIESINWLTENEIPPKAAIAIAGELELLIPLAGLIDMKAEIARVEKELNKLSGEHEKMLAKLSNTNFIANAPEEVVKKDQGRAAELASSIDKLKSQIAQLVNS